MKLSEIVETKAMRGSDMPAGYTEKTRWLYNARLKAYETFWSKAKEAMEKWLSKDEKAMCAADSNFARDVQITFQENLAIDAGCCPPTWTGWVSCKTCGDVPWLHGHKGTKVEGCPWCYSSTYQAYVKSLKEMKEADELGCPKELRPSELKAGCMAIQVDMEESHAAAA